LYFIDSVQQKVEKVNPEKEGTDLRERHAILIVDDQPEILNSLEQLFKKTYHIFRADHGEEALQLLKKHEVAVIISDQRMPKMTGAAFLEQSLKIQPDAVRILITAYADLLASIEAVNKGHIFYYVSKPWEPEELTLLVSRAVEQYRLIVENKNLTRALAEANLKLENENVQLRRSLEKEYDFQSIIGHSPQMLEVFKLVSKVIDTPTSVLLLGETGTGKELLAKAIHFNSKRRAKLFVTQNCGALPDTLLESELFGHVKGAFTGAVANKLGLFEQANGGTVFLDEIADTSPAMQQRLLRVLQEGEVKPVGSTAIRVVNVRIIAATNKDLENEVRDGRFREDLYYRLAVFPVRLPALRERREDIPELAAHFIQKFAQRIDKKIAGLEADSLALLQNAEFPGNIRELENEMERAVTLAEAGQTITANLLSPRFQLQRSGLKAQPATGLKNQVENLERELILKALADTKGNILKAAGQLGISRVGLHKKLVRYQIDPHKL
jgi:two-component system response regulator HupR/HoxA